MLIFFLLGCTKLEIFFENIKIWSLWLIFLFLVKSTKDVSTKGNTWTMTKWPYLDSWVRYKKHSVFTFSICGPGAEILTISFSNDSWNLTPRASKEEMVISRKSKDSMLSQTLKVEEKKVTIFFFLYLTQEPIT